MKKITALLLAALLLAALFAGCKQEEKNNAATTVPGTTAAPVSSTAAPEEPDPAQLFAQAAENMQALKSLGFRMDLTETVSMGEGENSFEMETGLQCEGRHSVDPDATYMKGSVKFFGMDMPMESYSFTQGNTLISYDWDEDEKIFLRSELPQEETDPAQDPEVDVSGLEWTASTENGLYVLKTQAGAREAEGLLFLTTGFLSGSSSLETLSDLTDPDAVGDLKDAKVDFTFRVDPKTGYLVGCVVDLNSLLAASLAQAGAEAGAGSATGVLELSYFDFDAAAPIAAPTEYREQEAMDWNDLDWDEIPSGETIDWNELASGESIDWDALFGEETEAPTE
ncbi:MAG: hypothetical protein IKS05_08390 [Oscillospiraceae bacterium]|nr:hypothetical protein [Oscillospiraceae bacterium]